MKAWLSFIFFFSLSSICAQENYWQVTNAPTSLKVVSITSNTNGVFLAAEDSGIYRSTNSGQDWLQINNGINYVFVMSLGIALNGDPFAGALGVFRSSNNGDIWIQSGVLNAAVLCFLFKPNGHILAGTGGGVYRSTDNGVSWILASGGLPNPSAIDVWSLISNNVGDVFAGTSNGIYHSTDEGNSWIEINNGLPTYPLVRTMVVNQAGVLFAGIQNGVYCSTDNGDNWFSSGLSASMVISLLINSSGDIFAGTYGNGVFISKDNGTNWTEINAGLTNWNVRCLTIDTNGFIFVGTDRGGVFRSLQPVTEIFDSNESNPLSYLLGQNYPNPFNSATAIQYSIPKRANITLKIYDILGKEVTTLVNEEKDPGVYTINFDANNLASGLYLYRIQAGSYIDTKKMILLK